MDPNSTIEGFPTLPLGIDEFSDVLSIADRAKTRQRAAVPSNGEGQSFELPPPTKRKAGPSSELIELTSDEDDYAPRSTTKSKPKPKPKPKAKTKELPPPPPESAVRKTDDVPKPKPRPRPRPRAVQSPAADFSIIQNEFSPTSSSTHGISIATSSPRAPAPHSDAPSSLPRIVTLGGPGGPVGSLFTDDEDHPSGPMENPVASSQPEFDELEPLPYSKPATSPPRLSPPPTFFASSPAGPSGKGRLSDEPPQIVDLTAPGPFPSTVESPVTTKKPIKAKNGRRKLTDITAVEEDNGEDGDFDPSTAKPKKSKPKTPKNKKKQPTCAELPAQVEVVITKKPPVSKGKGKEKEKDPPLFKSAEFIDDEDDDEEDPMPLRPQATVDQEDASSSKRLTSDGTSKLSSHASSSHPRPSGPTSSPFKTPQISKDTLKSKKRKAISDDSDLSSEEEAPAPKKSKGKAAGKGKGKRKEGTSSKAALDEDVFAEKVEKVKSKSKRRVVDSEDEGPEEVERTHGLIAESSKLAEKDRSSRSTKTGDSDSAQGADENMNVDINESNEAEEVVPKVSWLEPLFTIDAHPVL